MLGLGQLRESGSPSAEMGRRSGRAGFGVGAGRLTWRPWQFPRAARSSGASSPVPSSGRNKGGGARGAAAPRSQVARDRTRAPILPVGHSSASSPAMVLSPASLPAQRTAEGAARWAGPAGARARSGGVGPGPRAVLGPAHRPPPLRRLSGEGGAAAPRGRGGAGAEAPREMGGAGDAHAFRQPASSSRRILTRPVGYKRVRGQPSPDSGVRGSDSSDLTGSDKVTCGRACGMGNVVVTMFGKCNLPR